MAASPDSRGRPTPLDRGSLHRSIVFEGSPRMPLDAGPAYGLRRSTIGDTEADVVKWDDKRPIESSTGRIALQRARKATGLQKRQH